METTIYYFSATGNSLEVAKMLANEMNDCKLVSISHALKDKKFKVDSEIVGFVFPVFAWGMPRIVEEFVSSLSIKQGAYIFAVATCVAIPGNTLNKLKQTLNQNGANLNAGFAVASGRSSLMKRNFLDNIISKIDKPRLKLKEAKSRIAEMVLYIKSRVDVKPETSSFIANYFGSLFHNLAIEKFKNIDQEFEVSDSCIGCGACAKLCSRANIKLESNRPVFSHNCELCHSCIQWCPTFSIKHKNFDNALKQYHNASIKLDELTN